MLNISCGTVMTSKWVMIKMHNAFGKICGDNYVLEVFNPLWIAVDSLACLYMHSRKGSKLNPLE